MRPKKTTEEIVLASMIWVLPTVWFIAIETNNIMPSDRRYEWVWAACIVGTFSFWVAKNFKIRK